MGSLHGRERWMYSVRPSYDRFNAVWSGLLGAVLVFLGAIRVWPAIFLGLLLIALGVWSWRRASWTLAHPEVRERVTKRNDLRLTRHPRRYAVLAGLAFALVGVMELYKYTLGSRGDGHAPPVWGWAAAAAAGLALGLLVSRRRLSRARRRQRGIDPYPGQPSRQDQLSSGAAG